ncbi:MAG: DMT family transporter [Candidatus Eremiobacteraeota bacterium]|nr:DMT family transporter [Candidatus Eremiobacteraeota bacterium]MCW5869397.1 DMT family transporter [Candidatus Eremiobacteraeota bacterium]
MPHNSGIALALGASLCFSLMNALAKVSTLPPGEIACARGVVGLAVVSLMLARKGGTFWGKRPRVLLLRGLLGGTSLFLNFTALSGLTLGDASFLAHSSSLMVVCLAHFFLGERMPPRFHFLFGLAALGALLVIKPGAGIAHGWYALAGLGAALSAAGASLSIRNLSKDHDSHQIMFAFMAAAAVVPLPWTWSNFRVPGLWDAWGLVALSAVSYLGQYWLTLSYQHKEAAVVAMTRFAGVAFNLALGFLVWREIPDLASALGGLLILGSCIALYRWERRESAKAGRAG